MTVLYLGLIVSMMGVVCALLCVINLRARTRDLERRLFCTHRVSMLKGCHQCDAMLLGQRQP